MTTSADWEAEQERAVSIFGLLKRGRAWCAANPIWNLAVNLNGMNGCVDVKVFHDNQCVKSWLESEKMLHQMLSEATRFMGATSQWFDTYLASSTSCTPVTNTTAATTERRTGADKTQPVVWRNYTYCSRCNAQPGQQCTVIRSTRTAAKGDKCVVPHYGRLRFGVDT